MENASEALDTPTESSQPEEPTELSLSTTFELLKNRRRRDTLEYLLEHGGESTLSDLAEHIAAIENDIDIAQLSSDQRKRVYIGLYQCHLPKMDGAGVIDFDKHRGTVVLRDEAQQLVPYLEAESGRSQSAADATPAPGAAPASGDSADPDLGVSGVVAGVVGLALLAAASAVLPFALAGLWVGALVGVVTTVAVMAVRPRLGDDGPLSALATGRSETEQ